jgi:tetratricopeptide (TPR) repeat protein
VDRKNTNQLHGALKSIAAGLTTLLLIGWQMSSHVETDNEPWPVTKGAAAGYVPDEACAECHSGIWDSYQEVGMAQAFKRVRIPDMVENFEEADFYHEASGNHYRMEIRGEEIFQRRYRLDSKGQPYANFERKLDWVVGSGNHGRNYFYQTEMGELYQLPLVWYKDSGWGMAPGYDQRDHFGFGRLIDRQCMSCHNAYPEVASGSDLFGQPHLFPKDLPEGIGCQRCHGPGADHVRLAESDEATEEQLFAAIVNPGKLEASAREQLCHRCHMQPTTSVETAIQPFGVGDYAFQPGMLLEEALILVNIQERGLSSDRFEINHHAYRLASSPCYEESPGKLTCLTCHDPHRKVAPERRAEHYRNKCLSCHEVDTCSKTPAHVERAQVDADDCVSCHMPKHRPHEVVGVLMTDHRIRRKLAPPSWIKEIPESNYPFKTSALYQPAQIENNPHAATYHTLAESKSGDREAVLRLKAQLESQTGAGYEAWLALGDKLFEIEMREEALEAYRQTVALAPDHETGHIRLGSTLGNLGRSKEAITSLERALELNGDNPDAHLSLAKIFAGLGQIDQALPHFRRVIKLRPHLFEPKLELANLQLQKGNLRKAIHVYQTARDADPRIASAHDNLGLVYSMQDKWPAALQAWELGLECVPDDLSLAKRLAETRFTSPNKAIRSIKAGLKYARRAVEIDARDNDAQLLLAVGLIKTIDLEEAGKMATRTGLSKMDPDCWMLLRAHILGLQGFKKMSSDLYERFESSEREPHGGALHAFILAEFRSLPE